MLSFILFWHQKPFMARGSVQVATMLLGVYHATMASAYTVPLCVPTASSTARPISVRLAAGGPEGSSPFLRPTTATALATYLLGDWQLHKVSMYKVGGFSGRFKGNATFSRLEHDERTLLGYEESGVFRMVDPYAAEGDGEGAAAESQSVETRNGLVFDCTDWQLVHVYYNEPGSGASPRGPIELDKLRFLHSLRPDTLVMEAFADGDEFSGHLDIEADDCFVMTQGVQGEGQEGQLYSMFSRSDPQNVWATLRES